jgi:hypothetical protein
MMGSSFLKGVLPALLVVVAIRILKVRVLY